MSAPSDARDVAPEWEDQGSRIADALDDCASAVVIGDDPADAARVALGIARAQARHRRVVVADLVGEIAILQHHLPTDATYGLVDAAQYGVSLGKIAYPIDPAKNLYIIPSGVGPIDHTALLQSARWAALMRTFRQADTLVLLVAPARLRQLGALVRDTDGLVAVGDVEVADDARVISRVPAPVAEAASPPAPTPDASAPTASAPHSPDAPAPRATRPMPWLMLAIGAIAVALAAGAWMWNARRTASAGTLAAAPIAHDSAFARDTTVDVGAPASNAGLAIANPADSAIAAAYAVTLVTFNTAAAAEAQVDRSNGQGLPAVTISYVALGADSSRWYRVFVGAYHTRASADSLLGMMRRRGLLAASAGRVVEAPLAVLVRDKVPFSDAHTIATSYRAKGIPVYALVQDDGSYTLYAGAFESPEQAGQLLSTLRAAGENPAVVYRTGRVK